MSPPLFRIVAGNVPVSSELVESAQRVLPLLPPRHRARLRHALDELAELDAIAQRRRHAQRLQNRLFGRLADCVIEPGPHTLGALMHGLSQLRVFLFLRRLAPTRVTPNRREREADLQVRVAGRWLNVDVRPREAGQPPRERYLVLDRSEGTTARAPLAAVAGYTATFGLVQAGSERGRWKLLGQHLVIEDAVGAESARAAVEAHLAGQQATS